jgi:long-chain acyl-CoA synthetase
MTENKRNGRVAKHATQGAKRGRSLGKTRVRSGSGRDFMDQTVVATSGVADTFPKLLLQHAVERGSRVACREKEYGIWLSYDWARVRAEVEALACGLHTLGLKRGDRLIIVGDNRPHLYWSIAAAQALGAIPVPVYQDSVAAEMQYVVEHAEARLAIAENQEQVDKLIEIKANVAALQSVVFKDARGLRNYNQPWLQSYDAVQEKGRDFAKTNARFFTDEIAKGKGSDTAIMLYTSGTTGRPKGVMLSYDNLRIQAENAGRLEGLNEKDEILAYLPIAWAGDNIFSYAQSYVLGFAVNCPESAETVMADLREIGPTYFFAPPRIFENILTNVMIRMEDAGAPKRTMFKYFMGVARRVGTRLIDGKSVSPLDRVLYGIGTLLVYGPLKNTLGFSRVRLAYTAGEAIGPEIFDFYRSLGINIKQLYGSTEASVFVTIQPNGEVRSESVGKPVPQMEVKVAADGEVMFRGPGVFKEYYKNPQATAETKTADGWVHTGDAGFFDPDGHLRIIDRAKDVGRVGAGTMFPPKYIENKLKFFPHISEVVAFGDKRDFVACFINIDLQAVGNWAERHDIHYSSYQELAARPEVYELIKGEIEQVNRDLAADPNLAGAQIKRFLILHKALEADDGELTRTRKVRRGFVGERYAPLVAALYDGSQRCFIDTEVTFEDGRKGILRGDIAIGDAQVFPPTVMKKAS